MTVSRRDFLKAVGITSGCFTFGGAGLVAAQPNLLTPPDENLLPPPDEYTESKKEVFRQLYGGTATEPYVKDLDAPRYPSNDAYPRRYSSNDAFIPDIWAQTALKILNENMVVANTVHRDFTNTPVEYGDVVNAYKPMDFRQRRVSDEAPIGFEMATIQRVIVPLDAHFYSSFIIRDSDAARSFKDLVDMLVIPAMLAMSRGVDRYVIEKMWAEGDKNAVTNHDIQELILDARRQLNDNRAPLRDRHMIVPTKWLIPRFVDMDVQQHGAGRYLGFDIHEDVDVDQGIAFHQSALALLNRPLWKGSSIPEMGGRVAGASFDGMAMRCSMTYDSMTCGTRVTFDTLFGAAVVEPGMITVANKQEQAKRGVYYDPGVERPKFIAPPEKPLDELDAVMRNLQIDADFLRLEHRTDEG